MKITKVEVENFRSIKKYDFEVSDFNVFVGQNNHGKTNLFEALDWFDSGKTESSNYHNHKSDLVIKVRVYYKDVQATLNALENEAYKTAIQGVLGEHDEFVMEKTSEDDKRSMIVDGVNKGNPRGIDSALNYFLPKIEYVTTKIRLSDVSGYKAKSPIAEMLAGVLADVIKNDPKYKEFLKLFDELFNAPGSVFRDSVDDLEEKVEGYLQKQFSEETTVDFKIQDPKLEEMLKGFETEVDDGVKTRAENKGDGMQRAIMLAIIQAYADYRKEHNIARNFIFLIDEAELHLHPSAQRALKLALRDIVEHGGQVFVNTHSSVFANEKYDNQKIYNVRKVAGESNLETVETEQDRLDSIYQLLGGSPNDLLLPSNFIIVEGQTEFGFLRKIIERFYSGNKKCCNIKIIFARGDSEKHKEIYHAINQCYTPLLTNGVYKQKVVFLLDLPNKDQEKGFGEFKNAHPWLETNEQLYVLPTESIEEGYPETWKKKKGEVTGDKKVEYGVSVAEAITLEDFRGSMPVVYAMLEKAIEKGYE